MRVLHLLSNGPEPACAELLRLQGAECEVELVDLSKPDVDYGRLVDQIFASDKVICW